MRLISGNGSAQERRTRVVLLVASLTGLVLWWLCLNRAANRVGPAGYFVDLARQPAYLFSWMFLLVGLLTLSTAVCPPSRMRRSLFVGSSVGLFPEFLLTFPLLLEIPVGPEDDWLPHLAHLVDHLQLPGRLVFPPCDDRWSRGLADPPTWSTAVCLLEVNLANVLGWTLLALVASWLAGKVRRPSRMPQNKSVERTV